MPVKKNEPVNIHLPGGMNIPPFGIHQYLALIIVAVSLWALGSVWMGLQATGQWVGAWQQQVVLHVYLPQEHKKELKALQENLEAVDGVQKVSYVARENSAEWMQQWLGGSQLNVDTLAERLPETLLVHLLKHEENHFVIDDVRDVVKRTHADINQDELKLLSMRDILNKIEQFVWFATVLLILAMSLIVSNTLRMILLARADEVHLMRLMGAKEWFVRMPFVLEGMLLGATAGLLAWLLLWPWVWGSSEWLADSAIELHIASLLFPLLAGGAFLGCLGALIATARLVSPDSMENA
ncbi:MAG: permease-like cell division protein FtsX [Mariprofundaceae bacterium]|nr:permease-like cell division protein FtsX [Mariprofundaceae bacterium]